MKNNKFITESNVDLVEPGDRLRFHATEYHRDDWEGPRDFDVTVLRTILRSIHGPRIMTVEKIADGDDRQENDFYLADDWEITLLADATAQSQAPANVEQTSWHRGSWMQTYTGRQFYPLDPQAEDVDITDIAHALSMQCRYNGHVRRFMSVAEHCVLMSGLVAPENALWALLHDATEAYVGDMIRPLKLHMPEYRAVEDKVMLAIAQKFQIDPVMPAQVHEADSRILLDERAALLGEPAGEWQVTGEPFGITIPAWTPHRAEQEYLQRFVDLVAPGMTRAEYLEGASS